MKSLKIFIMLVCLSFLTIAPVFAEDNTDPPVNYEQEPLFALKSSHSLEITAGMKKTIDIEIKNISNYEAYDINVFLLPENDDASRIQTSYLNNSNYISYCSNGSEKKISIDFFAPVQVKSGVYNYMLKITYSNKFKRSFIKTEEKLSVHVKNDSSSQSFVSLSDFHLEPSILYNGKSSTFTAKLKNTGSAKASDVQIVCEGLNSNEITLRDSSANYYYPSIAPSEQRDIRFTFYASSGIRAGNYPIKFLVNYKDAEGKEQKNETTYYISVKREGGQTGAGNFLKIVNMRFPKQKIKAGQNFSVQFDVKNMGADSLQNIKVVAVNDPEKAIVPASSSILTLDELAKGASFPMNFDFNITSEASSKNYPIEFKISYQDGRLSDGNENTYEYSQYASVNVDNPLKSEGSESSVPKIIVSDYKSNPRIVNAGEEFDLDITFMNTHPDKEVKNIKLYLTLTEDTESTQEKTGNVFTPVDSSNTFFIDKILPKNTQKKHLRLYTVPTAQPKNYTLTVNFEYEDRQNKQYTGKELLGINVTQPIKLEVSEITFPQHISMADGLPVRFEIRNTGNVKASNLKVIVDTQDFEVEEQSRYMSNLDSGQYDEFDTMLYPKNIGQSHFKISIFYDSPKGETIEIPYEFSVTVEEAPPMPDVEFPEGEMKDKFSKTPFIIGLVVIVLGAGAVFYIKRKKKIKDSIDDE